MRKLLLAVLTMCAFAVPAVAEEKPDAPATIEGATTVSAEEAKALFDEGVLFVDTREDAAWDLGRIPGAVHLDVKTDKFSKEGLEAHAKLDEKILFYCSGIKCNRSTTATEKALSYGYKHVYYFREGFPAWKTAGYPVE